MVGMAYAAVPLYDMFCQVTGYNGTTQRVEQASDVILDRKIKVTFDANIAAGPALGLQAGAARDRAEDRRDRPGEFTATNRSKKPTTGQAVFNVTPMAAGAYFNKVQCFCFTETTLKPGEKMEMPVVFFVDPEIVKAVETKNIHTITLSYTFYAREPSKPVASHDGEAGRRLTTKL